MANRPSPFPDDDGGGPRLPAALERARADLSRLSRSSQSEPSQPGTTAPVLPDAAQLPAEDGAMLARIDLLRGRLAKAHDDTVSALMFLSDAQQDCDALAEACSAAGWTMMGTGIALLSDALRRALPTEPRHLALIGLLTDALYALRRAELRTDMQQAGNDLLRGLRLAAGRELGDRPI